MVLRHVSPLRTQRVSSLSLSANESLAEMDSHVDTCVVGANALIIIDFERPVQVTGYDSSKKSKPFRIVSGVLAYDDPYTGRTHMLVVHQAISMPQIEHNLLCPMQMRQNDVEVDERPKFFTVKPTEKSHAIVAKNEAEELIIPLQLDGMTSYFATRKPTKDEFEGSDSVFELTAQGPEWDPQTTSYAEQEAAMLDHKGEVIEKAEHPPFYICHLESCTKMDREDHEFDFEFGMALEANRSVSAVDAKVPAEMAAGGLDSQKRPPLEAKVLAKRWHISEDAARRTLQKTTQRGVRTVLNPALSRRFQSNDRQLR